MDLTPRNQRSPISGKLRVVNTTGKARVLDADGRQHRLRVESGTPVHGVAATGTLTGTTIATADTVTIGSLIYTFITALTDPAVPFEVLVGVSDSVSLDNLIAAINGDAGEGTTYAAGTTAHTLVTAAAGTGDTMDVTAVNPGVAGNIATTDALTSGAWGAATLTGGIDATEGSAGDQLYDGSYLYTAIADVEITSTSGWRKSSHAAL